MASVVPDSVEQLRSKFVYLQTGISIGMLVHVTRGGRSVGLKKGQTSQLDLLFYNGIAVVSQDRPALEVLKKIFESTVFYEYIKSTTKDYSSGYISLSRNYLKNFGIPDLTPEQQEELLDTDDPDTFVRLLYEGT